MSVRKATALRCQTVYIGSLDLGGTVTTNVAIAQVINVDNDYIGLESVEAGDCCATAGKTLNPIPTVKERDPVRSLCFMFHSIYRLIQHPCK